MATSSTRQRKLARAKLDRQLARRAERERRHRQLRAVAAGVVTLLVATLGGLWLGGVFDKEPVAPPVADECTWNPQNVAANTNLRDVGTPKTTGIASSGTSAMTVQLNTGTVSIELDRSLAKCAAAGLTYLASSGYYNNTKCHELTSGDGSFALRCGDHSGTGNGGAAFTWSPENVPDPAPTSGTDPSASPGPSADPSPSASPTAETIRYPAGTVAMSPALSGSQFLIFYQDSPAASADYSIVGRVTSGLDVVEKIAEAGAVDNGQGANTKPKEDVIIQSLTVVQTQAPPPSAEPSTEPTAQPTPSATPSS